MNAGAAARRYMRPHRHGVVSGISKKFGGYPFGSVVPCVPDHAAWPVMLISRLAEHTKNIEADPRVSLLVCADGEILRFDLVLPVVAANTARAALVALGDQARA